MSVTLCATVAYLFQPNLLILLLKLKGETVRYIKVVSGVVRCVTVRQG